MKPRLLAVLHIPALVAALALPTLSVGCGNGGAAENVDIILTSEGATISPTKVSADAERIVVTVRNDTDEAVSPLLHVHGQTAGGEALVEVGEIAPGATKTAEVELPEAVDYELMWMPPLFHIHPVGVGSSAACLQPLPPVTNQPLTQAAFEAADEQLLETIELAEAGDVDGAEAAFFGGTHDLTHDIDQPLREVNEALAIRLCDEVVIMEQELEGRRDPSVVRDQAQMIRALLAAAAVALGLEPP